jgi:hypothetical protein
MSEQFKQFYLNPQEQNSPFDYVGGEYILKSTIKTRDFVDGQSGFKFDPRGFSKISAFGGNVTLYDAVVDASGKGQFKTIQDALNAGKKRIFVRSGTYEISSTIDVLSSNVYIVGEGKNSTVLQLSANSASGCKLINIAGDDCVLENIKIDGNRANQIETNQYLIFLDANFFSMSNCNVVNGSGFGLYEDGYYSGHLISRNNFLNNIKNALIKMGNGTVENNIFQLYYDRTLDTTNENVYLDSFSAIFSNNVLTGGKYGIYAVDLAANITNNYIYSCVIGMEVANNMYGSIISSNSFGFSQNGLVFEGAERNLINSNYLQSNASLANTYIGIQFKEGDRNPSYNTINSNLIAANSESLKYGIEENSASSNYQIITGNICKNIGTQGIYSQGVNTVVANNIE